MRVNSIQYCVTLGLCTTISRNSRRALDSWQRFLKTMQRRISCCVGFGSLRTCSRLSWYSCPRSTVHSWR